MHNETMLYNVTTQKDMLCKCIYKSVSICVLMELTFLQNIFLPLDTLREFVSTSVDTVVAKMLERRFYKKTYIYSYIDEIV